MGHTRTRGPPRSRAWRRVQAAIIAGDSPVAVASAVLDATGKVLSDAGNNAAFAESFRLLAQVVMAAREPDLAAALRKLGLPVDTEQVGLAGLTSGFMAAADAIIDGHDTRTDVVELAELSAAEALSRALTGGQGWAPTPDQLHQRLSGLSDGATFSLVARQFVSRFLFRYLTYYTSRELPLHVGELPHLRDLGDYQRFDRALERDCWNASAVVDRFAGSWFARARAEGEITPNSAGAFVSYALDRVVEALRAGAA